MQTYPNECALPLSRQPRLGARSVEEDFRDCGTELLSNEKRALRLERLNVVAACDENFAQHSAVMLTSLLLSQGVKSNLISIHILVPETFSDENRNKIIASLDRFDASIIFVYVDPVRVSGLKLSGHLTSVAYYRLFLVEFLPNNVKKVLWLDSDILVIGDIFELYNIDLSSHPIGAVHDAFWANWGPRKLYFEGDKYFNSGMMLIDLECWRSQNIGSRAAEFARRHPELIVFHDQCALNHVIGDNYKSLEKKWNLQTAHITTSEYRTQKLSHNKEDSRVIHFSSESKPWQYSCQHPMKRIYFDYIKLTVWRDFKEQDRTAKKVAIKFLRRYAPWLAPLYRSVLRAKALFYRPSRSLPGI